MPKKIYNHKISMNLINFIKFKIKKLHTHNYDIVFLLFLIMIYFILLNPVWPIYV